MTVIEFKKREMKGNIFITTTIVLIFASFIGGVFLYNEVAALRQDIASKRTTLAHAQVLNAELKNDMYQFLDEATQETFLQSRGLVSEKHPQYSETASTVATQNP